MARVGGLGGWLGDQWDGVGESRGAKVRGELGAWPHKECEWRQKALLSCPTTELPG